MLTGNKMELNKTFKKTAFKLNLSMKLSEKLNKNYKISLNFY